MSPLLTFDDEPETVPAFRTADRPEDPAQTAVECQQAIEALKLRIEELTATRDEAIKAALAGGVKIYGGYTFVKKTPSASISEKKLAETHPDVMDGFIKWYGETHAPKLSKSELTKYLKVTEYTNPDAVLEDCTEAGKGKPTYSLVKNKEASE